MITFGFFIQFVIYIYHIQFKSFYIIFKTRKLLLKKRFQKILYNKKNNSKNIIN